MIWFLIAAIALWGLGHLMRAPPFTRWSLIALLYCAIIIAHAVLPVDNPLRQTLGGGLKEWLVLAGGVALFFGYRFVLHQLRTRATPKPAENTGSFSQTELDRYGRHIVLREIGGPGQKRLKEARVLVIGAGGLGSPALQYLAGAGVGTIGLIDDDLVDNSNLQRQIIHTDASIGTPKVFSAQTAMQAQNPFVKIRPYNRRLTAEFAAQLFDQYDLILDGTDNFETRYLVNETCVALKKPLISAALSQWEGQISTFDPVNGTPCYKCIFPTAPADGLAPSCAEAGVLGPLPGVVGAMMAVEAIKEITQAGTGLRGKMMIYDALYGESRMINLKRRDDCDVCGSRKVA